MTGRRAVTLLHIAMLILLVAALVASAQEGGGVISLDTYRIGQLEKAVSEIRDALGAQQKLLLTNLGAVVAALVVHVVTGRRKP